MIAIYKHVNDLIKQGLYNNANSYFERNIGQSINYGLGIIHNLSLLEHEDKVLEYYIQKFPHYFDDDYILKSINDINPDSRKYQILLDKLLNYRYEVSRRNYKIRKYVWYCMGNNQVDKLNNFILNLRARKFKTFRLPNIYQDICGRDDNWKQLFMSIQTGLPVTIFNDSIGYTKCRHNLIEKIIFRFNMWYDLDILDTLSPIVTITHINDKNDEQKRVTTQLYNIFTALHNFTKIRHESIFKLFNIPLEAFKIILSFI